jgi:hypothetical protein
MKTLKQIIEGYEDSATKDTQDFVKKHKVEVKADAAGNGDDVFKASKVKEIQRKKERHGYSTPEDEKVHEEAMTEMSDAEMKKREVIVKGMKKNLKDFTKRYGKDAKSVMYATATKMAMSEEAEDLNEGPEAEKRYGDYHAATMDLISKIGDHVKSAHDNKPANVHWGHVGDMRRVHDQLRDIHDALAQQGEYAKEAQALSVTVPHIGVREELEADDAEIDQLAESYMIVIDAILESLDEEARDELVEALDDEESFNAVIDYIDAMIVEENEAGKSGE